jgi:hypothetical protein
MRLHIIERRPQLIPGKRCCVGSPQPRRSLDLNRRILG